MGYVILIQPSFSRVMILIHNYISGLRSCSILEACQISRIAKWGVDHWMSCYFSFYFILSMQCVASCHWSLQCTPEQSWPTSSYCCLWPCLTVCEQTNQVLPKRLKQLCAGCCPCVHPAVKEGAQPPPSAASPTLPGQPIFELPHIAHTPHPWGCCCHYLHIPAGNWGMVRRN